MDLKSQIQSTFKLSGLTVRIEASKYLAGLLAPVPDDDRYINIVMSFVNIRHGIMQGDFFNCPIDRFQKTLEP